MSSPRTADPAGAGAGATRIAVTGSIATDHLTSFPGLFTDQLIADRLHTVSLSFLVDELEVRRGGVAANIAFGLGCLGLRPVLVGAVGADFAEYRVWLKEHGVDTDFVHVSAERQTARFQCITDRAQNQIASFYSGAMEEAAGIDLAPVARRPGGIDLVLVSPNDPRAMLRHTAQCRELGLPFASDPSQQLPRLTREQARDLVDGARWLFTNDYEASLLLELTGWRQEDVLARVGTWLVTRAEHGVTLHRRDTAPVDVPAVPTTRIADPTGVGDAFRAGFLATAPALDPADAARFGCTLAVLALESVGPQDYTATRESLLPRIETAYGPAVAETITTALALPGDEPSHDPA
ncbi:carbohydrate kinase family protein [Streptomyces griseoflavus]|uniref:carbohydrate kinase family protein n=1 Tax=Streptomyces griseoflavus TaxID=35619 RepID=UPI0033A5785A